MLLVPPCSSLALSGRTYAGRACLGLCLASLQARIKSTRTLYLAGSAHFSTAVPSTLKAQNDYLTPKSADSRNRYQLRPELSNYDSALLEVSYASLICAIFGQRLAAGLS